MSFETSEKYILYVQWEVKLDDQYIYLAARFREAGVTLVPVKPTEIDYFLSSRTVPLIMMTRTMAQYQKFLSMKKRHFDFFLKSGKISLIHLNSFKEIADYATFKPRKNYSVINLPLTTNAIVRQVLLDYGQEESSSKRWPGGRRSKLPEIGGES